MTKSFDATWLGDEDAQRQSINMFGLTFVKGEAVKVPGDFPQAAKIRNNPMFSVEKDAEIIESEEPEPPDIEAGTELAAAKEEARGLGLEVKGNPKVETVRAQIAAHHAKLARG